MRYSINIKYSEIKSLFDEEQDRNKNEQKVIDVVDEEDLPF